MSNTASPQLIEVGETIRRHRHEAGLSARQLAGLVGRDHSNVLRIENGMCPDLTVETLMAFSRALRINPATLVAPFFTAPGSKQAA
jgi:transcriptional regulator with XRE-family HTH domain